MRAFTLCTVAACSLCAFSLPLYEAPLYARNGVMVLPREPVPYLVDRS